MFELDTKSRLIIIGMILVPIILILVISEITGLTERQYKEEILKNNYKAKIDCIFIDRYNHSEPTILLDNKKIFPIILFLKKIGLELEIV